MIDRKQQIALLELAAQAREHSYSPYSNYSVGAALLTSDGSVYQGCNIENASFTPTICAERTAFFKAIYDGVREFSAIAIIGSGKSPAYPCGVCRQVMSEFCDGDFLIITANCDQSEIVTETLDQMMPHRFGPKDLL